MSPRLTPRAAGLMPAMFAKVREMLPDVLVSGADISAIPGAKSDAFAMKLLGLATESRLRPDDPVLQDVVASLDAGAMSPDESRLLERELPRMTGLARRLLVKGDASDLSPSDVRAALLADFINARSDEGTMGENLHIGVRRIFERYFKLFDGAQSIANRAGFYRPGDLFEPLRRSRAAVESLQPTEPGEASKPR